MYNLPMKTYSASLARASLAEVLDLAESGRPVTIERAGTRFRVEIERPKGRARRPRVVVDFLEPAVAAGQWTWAGDEDGLVFAARPGGR